MRLHRLLIPVLLVFVICPDGSGAQVNIPPPLPPPPAPDVTKTCMGEALKGDAGAQYCLGSAYARGNGGVAQDYGEALKWYLKAAEQNYTLAQFALGEMYSRGTGIPQDHTEAAKWYRKAAENGETRAQVSLGSIYVQGLGVPRDNAEAAKWYRKAAEQNNPVAQTMLGSMYAAGLGVIKDPIQAYMWLTLSTAAGATEKQNPFFQKATDLRDSLTKEMTPQQIEEAGKLAESWQSRRPPAPIRVGTQVLESKLIKKVEPVYPELAKRARVSGTVVMAVIVDEWGNVSDVRVNSGHPLLDGAAVTAVRQWKYSPTLLNGEPVPVIATVTVVFGLRY